MLHKIADRTVHQKVYRSVPLSVRQILICKTAYFMLSHNRKECKNSHSGANYCDCLLFSYLTTPMGGTFYI